MVRRLHPLAALLAVAALAQPTASPAAPQRPMYVVSMSGTASTQLTWRESLEAPEGCSAGDAMEAKRFTASARLRSTRRPVSIGKYSTIAFRARLGGVDVSASRQTTGHWEKPFGEPDPLGSCSFAPQARELPCSVPRSATHRPGVVVDLWIDYRGTEISYGGRQPLVSCEGMGEASEAATLLPYQEDLGGYRVSLRRHALDRLAVGRSIFASGSSTHRWGDRYLVSGSDTLAYRVRVKRVR